MKNRESGAVLFYIFLVVALLAMLTFAVVRMGSESRTGSSTALQQRDQVSTLIGQASLISSALQQMSANANVSAATFATNLSTVTGGNTWDTAPHIYKLYHPYGGGVSFMSQTGTGAALSDTNIANNFQIRTASYVKGIGATDATSPPDILFTAQVSTLAVCQLINNIVRGTVLTATPPTVTNTNTAFANLFTNATGGSGAGANAVLDDTSDTCTACVNVSASCVQNTGATLFGYYQVLVPG
jgi:hypothetical protein